VDINILTSLNDNIRIDREKCNACGKCVEVCILDNLRLQLSPCRQACPIGMNCQGYIRQLARGKWEDGLEKIREANPFAGILGRVCSRLCEAACSRTKVDGQPVAIRDLKRFLSDQGQPLAPVVGQVLPMKVGIVGAGPAGLTAAYSLRAKGFQVTLYDRESVPGGLLRWAIPEFRLPQEVLERDLAILPAMGVEFIPNRTLGNDLTLQALEEKFDAVLLAIGTYGQARLQIPGEDSRDVWPVLEFMKRMRQKRFPRVGKRVIVIGGGNAAVDAAQTALRLGAQKVHLASLERKGEMPAFPWSISEAEEEGVNIQNGWGPKEFRLEGKKLIGVSFNKCASVMDSRGNFCPTYDGKSTLDLPADTVIVAIGQKPELGLVDPSLHGSLGILCDPLTLQTPKAKIFSAGDCTSGPKTIVEAMAQGREAALSIQRFLRGEDLYYGRGNGRPHELHFEADLSRAKPGGRVAMPSLPLSQRKAYEEVARGYSRQEALAEAERCLNCGLPFGLRTCWFCLPCEIECPEEALYVEIPYLLR
jgi:NADPH-dependent glutamate synthase beta subunit-like oxidoreductase